MISEVDQPHVRVGGTAGSVSLCLVDRILWITIENEPLGSHFIAAFKTALKQGWLQPNMRTLIDLTRFTGPVDWQAMFAIRDMAPWGTVPNTKSKAAYVVRNDMFGALVRIACAMFTRTRHKVFSGEREALEWLKSCGGA